MITYLNKKVSATELAKLIINNKGQTGVEFWDEDPCIKYDDITNREIDLINEAMDRQTERIQKFLGLNKIWNKMDNSPKVNPNIDNNFYLSRELDKIDN